MAGELLAYVNVSPEPVEKYASGVKSCRQNSFSPSTRSDHESERKTLWLVTPPWRYSVRVYRLSGVGCEGKVRKESVRKLYIYIHTHTHTNII